MSKKTLGQKGLDKKNWGKEKYKKVSIKEKKLSKK